MEPLEKPLALLGLLELQPDERPSDADAQTRLLGGDRDSKNQLKENYEQLYSKETIVS